MKLKTIDKAAAKQLRDELGALLTSSPAMAFAQAHGLRIVVGNASFDGRKITFKVELALIEAALPGYVIDIASMRGFDVRGTSTDGRFKVTDYSRGKAPWRMELADGSDGRFWKAGDGWMKANFPPWTEPLRMAAREVEPGESLIEGEG